MLEVEEILLGPVLRKLNGMPGIAKLHLDLGHGGQVGAKKAAKQVAAARDANGGNNEQQLVKLLAHGPKPISEITSLLGGAKSRAYGVIHALKKKGIIEAGPDRGTHQLTERAMAQLGARPALPAPEVKHGPAGRASPGSGNIVLRAVLDAGPLPAADVRKEMEAKGMSPKSASGVLDRARKGGIVKKNGNGYELTAKGMKIELTAGAAHG
jgi:DNA-binding PadR family transcriptional regulator